MTTVKILNRADGTVRIIEAEFGQDIPLEEDEEIMFEPRFTPNGLLYTPNGLIYGRSFTSIASEVHRIARAHGWWDDGDRNFGEVIALIHSEASEALEEWRDGKPAKIYYNPEKPSKPEGIVVEMADIVIRVMDWCHHEGLDLEGAILTKMAYNETREYKHGKLA